VTRVEDRICSTCRGRVFPSDVACRHCGTSFRVASRPSGNFVNDFFRAALACCALSLPMLCLLRGFFAPDGWGDFVAYWTSQLYFVPWLVGVISLSVMTWLTQERR
jgi:hypothetical protein